MIETIISALYFVIMVGYISIHLIGAAALLLLFLILAAAFIGILTRFLIFIGDYFKTVVKYLFIYITAIIGILIIAVYTVYTYIKKVFHRNIEYGANS